MTPLEQLKAKLQELKKARELATQGEWINGYPNAGITHETEGHIWTENKHLVAKGVDDEDLDFIMTAANSWLSLIEKLELCIETMEKCSDYLELFNFAKDKKRVYQTHDLLIETLQKLTEMDK